MKMEEQAKADAAKKGLPAESPSQAEGLPAGVAIAVLVGLALVVPIFGIASVSGVLNALIIIFGLMQAWRHTRKDDTLIAGPYQPEQAAAAGA